MTIAPNRCAEMVQERLFDEYIEEGISAFLQFIIARYMDNPRLGYQISQFAMVHALLAVVERIRDCSLDQARDWMMEYLPTVVFEEKENASCP